MPEIAAGERPNAARIKRQIALAKQAEKCAPESPPQERELQEVQDREHSQSEAATDELIAMLLDWDRFGEFMALLRNAVLSIVTQALRNHQDRLAAIGGTEGELVSVGSSATSPEPEEAETPLETVAEAVAVLDVLTRETAKRTFAGAAGRADPESAVSGIINDVSAEELLSVWGSLKQNPQWYGRQWVAEGCPIAVHHQENPFITNRLSEFRAAASKASDTERQRFLDLTAPQAA